MKLAVTVAGEQAGPAAFTVWKGFEQSIEKAHALGYQGVELALESAEEIDRAMLRRWLSRCRMDVSAISTGRVFADRGLYFTHPEPEVRMRTLNAFRELIELAADFGAAINIGRARGYIAPQQTRQDAERLFRDALETLCDPAERRGVCIVVEPVNRYEINFINSVEEGAAFVAGLNAEGCGIMADVFHMNIEDRHVGESLVLYAPWIKYLHLADSNRRAPGQGHLDFEDIFACLKRADYDGWASVEILPLPDPDTAARQAAEYLLPKIEAYNRAL